MTGREDGIKLRVIGGTGNDVLDDSQGGGTRMSDSQGRNRVVDGPGTRNDTRPYEPPPPPENAPWLPRKDFDSATWRLPWTGYNSDFGFFLGQGLEHRRYGFRKDYFSSRHVFRAGYAFGETSGRFDYSGTFNRENSRDSLGLAFYWSGIEVLRFYGFGNETANNGDKDFYRARQNQVVLYPSYTWSITRTASLTMGPVGRYSRPATAGRNLLSSTRPDRSTVAATSVRPGLTPSSSWTAATTLHTPVAAASWPSGARSGPRSGTPTARTAR